jgi:large subunit ribosomal protein L25
LQGSAQPCFASCTQDLVSKILFSRDLFRRTFNAMADITLNAELRTLTGSAASGRLRTAGKLPGIVYGKGTQPVCISLDHHEVSLAFKTMESRTEPFTIVLDGKSLVVKMQEIQRDPVRRNARHLDLKLV